MKAIFYRDFSYTSRKTNAGWAVLAMSEPQTYPRELIDAAVAAGVARIVPPLRAKTADEPDHDCLNEGENHGEGRNAGVPPAHTGT